MREKAMLESRMERATTKSSSWRSNTKRGQSIVHKSRYKDENHSKETLP